MSLIAKAFAPDGASGRDSQTLDQQPRNPLPLADATPYPILMPCQSFLGKRGTKFQSKFGPTQEGDKWRVPL